VEEEAVSTLSVSKCARNGTPNCVKAIKTKVKTQIWMACLATTALTGPKALVATEIGFRLREQAVQQFRRCQPSSPSSCLAELFEEQAKRRGQPGSDRLLNVVQAERDQAGIDRVRAWLKNLASAYQEPEQVINWYYQNEQQLARNSVGCARRDKWWILFLQKAQVPKNWFLMRML